MFRDMEQFDLTERAAARIAEIVAAEGLPKGGKPALRVAVLAGGCSGFQYRFELDHTAQEDDLVIERGGARVLVDPASLDLLAGAGLDYTDELMGSHFAVRNPNAKSACGCGTSFSVD
jgi:iron-sulfur cluster assembly accessory protein